MSSINARVPPLRLAAVDTPTDGQLPSYQASSGQFEWVDDQAGGGTVTSVALTESGTALSISGSPITGAGTFNIAGAGTSSQVILGDLTLGTLTSGTVTSVGLTETGSALTITGSPVTGSGTFNIAGAGTSSQVILGDLSLGTLTSGTVTSVALTETGTALTITGSPVTGSGTFNIAGAGTSSQVILGDLSLGTLTSGTVTGTGSANQVSYWTGASVQAGSTGLTYDPSTGDLTVGGYVETGTKVTTPSGTSLTLDTHNGTASGSIVIANGANGQISLNPNGTGTVKIDGVEIDNSAIATGYVLKATSASVAGWAAESGGGGGIGGSITDNQVAVGATTADEIEGYSDFTYDNSLDTLTVGEKIESSGTSQLQLIAGSSSISILDSGVANHINISPASGRINAQSSTLSVGTGSADTTISSNGAYNLTLNTNDGTNSGSIVITDGVDGQVTISANGSGTIKLGAANNPVTVSSVYTLPTAVTTDNNYVLTAQTDGSTAWAASGGSGGIDPLSFSTSQGLAVTAYWLLGLNPAYSSAFDFQAYTTSHSGFLVKFQPPFTGTSGLYFYTSVASGAADNYLWIYEESATGYAGTFVGKILLPTSSTGGQSVTQWLDAAGSNITSPTFTQGNTYIAVLEVGSSFTASSGRQGNIPFVTIATVAAFASPTAEVFNQQYTGTIDSSLPDSEINFFSSAIGWPMLGLSL